MTRTTISAMMLALIVFCHAAGAAENLDAAKAVVEKLHTTLLGVMMDAEALGYAGRVEKLDPVLHETFDFATISRIVVGRDWKSLDEDKRRDFIDLFEKLSAATYASNFDGFSGESFETLGVEERRGRILVKTVIVTADHERVTIDYLLLNNNGVWQIVNVIADGVSDLSLKRADYTAVIKNQGFDSLVTKLNGKIANYGSSGRTGP
jgi:phospholipid transport system substrate-binding protein